RMNGACELLALRAREIKIVNRENRSVAAIIVEKELCECRESRLAAALRPANPNDDCPFEGGLPLNQDRRQRLIKSFDCRHKVRRHFLASGQRLKFCLQLRVEHQTTRSGGT